MQQEQQRNRLLLSVEPKILEEFSTRLARCDLRKGENLQSPGESVDWVYFPDGALIGALTETVSGESVVTALIGFDGALGVFEACGSRVGHIRGDVLVPGKAWRMRASAYRALYDASPALRTSVHKHVEILLAESRQSVACNALHAVEARLARAILETVDKCDAENILHLTQESIAHMLGVQRTTVAVCISALQKQGILRSGRGNVEIVDRPALQKASCACHETLVVEREEIYATRAESCDA